ncbi:MAG: ribonucleoside-diphosphate reductase, adenosylcobalamin-dependent [Betaproteobacteria bacterium RIFCSPLOWO2_12_FULL_62_58]|nr:MAG: ribonucleoside-diphosphate reductase, adenosylcobalamin-dependent [Betaproteobacteria bacterium RIFCSPLOWO2_12_FULL_62_58]
MPATGFPFFAEVSRQIWDAKYRLKDPAGKPERTMADTWLRIARSLAGVEKTDSARWEQAFRSVLDGFRFLPGGRILAGAGTGHRVTLFNCFVMGAIEDSLDGIFDALKEGALTMQQGGGVGYDFSTLRPAGMRAHSTGMIASGPVSFMRIWDAMCATILSTGARRGAMMATLRCDHPDIEAFIDAKREPGVLRHFNLSVLVTDEFMRAVQAGADWPLVFPLGTTAPAGAETVERTWSGSRVAQRCRVFRRARARALWERIMRANYEYAEPGVIFIDHVRKANNLWYCETISATNPCGEIPLPPYGACNLGSINLTQFVRDPFSPRAAIDLEGIAGTAAVATRLLDDVYETSRFPLPQQRAVAHASRRIGLGITGLADALVMLGIEYGTPRSLELAGEVMRTICHSAYQASIGLAREKGAFPQFRAAEYTQGEFVNALPPSIVDDIRHYGIRNSHLTAVAPAGTISLLAGNVSSGLEPIYAGDYLRSVRLADDTVKSFEVSDYACALYRELRGTSGPPPAFAAASQIDPRAHLAMQAALQPYVDNAISKTINVPENLDFAAFCSLYEEAYALGLKGCTTFRPNPVTGAVLTSRTVAEAPAHCCSIEREAD